jgi:hypothetical protein
MSAHQPAMSPDDPPDLSAAEEAFLETEADRVLAPLKARMSAEAFQIIRDTFLDVAATHPEATRLRKLALAEGGPVGRSRATTDEGAAEGKAVTGKAKPKPKGKRR